MEAQLLASEILIREENNEKKRINSIIESNIEYAKKLVGYFYLPNSKSGITYEDLESAALYGLCSAAQKFLGTNNFHFRSYARTRIKGAMIDVVRRDSNISDIAFKLLKQNNDLNSESSYNELTLLADSEIKDAAKTTNKRGRNLAVITKLSDFKNAAPELEELNMKAFPRSSGKGKADLTYYEDVSPENNYLVEKENEAWDVLLGKLSDKERLIVELYYLSGISLEQIRTLYNVSRATISRWHTRALDKLKLHLDNAPELLEALLNKGR